MNSPVKASRKRIVISGSIGFLIAVVAGTLLFARGGTPIALYIALFAGAYVSGIIGRERGYVSGLITGALVSVFGILTFIAFGRHRTSSILINVATSSLVIGTVSGWLGSFLPKALALLNPDKNQPSKGE